MQQRQPVPTKVLCLPRVVDRGDLINDGQYEDIMEDIRAKAQKYGELVNVVIPCPRPCEETPGVGKIFLKYANIESAVAARAGLNGRLFRGYEMVPWFYPENKFAQGNYSAYSA